MRRGELHDRCAGGTLGDGIETPKFRANETVRRQTGVRSVIGKPWPANRDSSTNRFPLLQGEWTCSSTELDRARAVETPSHDRHATQSKLWRVHSEFVSQDRLGSDQ